MVVPMRLVQPCSILAIALVGGVAFARPVAADDTAALVRLRLPGQDASLADALAAELKAAGYAVSELDGAALCDPARLTAKQYSLLALPDATALPVKCVPSISAYLKAGGDIIALNAPLWRSPLINADGRWISRDDHQRDAATRLPPNVLLDFGPAELPRWQRSTNTPANSATYETVNDGPSPTGRCLHVVVSNLDGWDTFLAPDKTNPFPSGHTLTVLSARGGPDTPQLAVEWTEKDGSRWVAVIPLSPEWRQYVIPPNDFRYWESNPARGHGSDRFKPENAVRLSVGVSFSHTGHLRGRREYWVGPIGTAALTGDYEDLTTAFNPPPMDMLSPAYKYFDCHDVRALLPRSDQAIVGWAVPTAPIFPVPSELRSPHPRASGAGFEKGRAWRFIALIEARTADGEWRGTPATLLVHADGPFKGGLWASFGVSDAGWYKSSAVMKAIGQIARRMRQGVFIVDAGTNFYTYFDAQEIKLGVRAVNLSDEKREGLTVRVTLADAGSGQAVVTKQWPFAFNAAEEKTVSETWKPDHWPDHGLRATAEILDGANVIDRVVHDVNVWRPKTKNSFITIKDGDFMLDGRRWRAHGVNYMPSSGVGTEDGPYFEQWVGARSYDPEVIERDLRHIKDLGLNAVSIFIYNGSVRAQNLLDLLRLLDKHGLKANVSLRPSWPLDFKFAPVREIIDYYRLWEHDTIFAFDLAWEPMFGPHEGRVPHDADWEAWIVERYGSLAAAEKDWAFPVPRTPAGKVTNPLPAQIDTDGPWRRMTAAYRRFLDTLLYTNYNAARALVRGVDPNHFVSFRMAEGGNPTFRWQGRIPYDFAYIAAAVDFLSPEAYGRIGDWEQVKPGWFEFEYARFAAPAKPMIWAEMGTSVWDLGRMQDAPGALEFQARFFRTFYRMLVASGADGVFFWFYPGGFRCHENSDFGIINPDGSDRPVSQVIRENAKAFLDGPGARPIDHWIEIDRDKHPDGIAGIYDEAKADFWKAIDAGKVPGLKTAGTGMTSADCPLLAVGNTPCNSTNPPKYLDGAFDRIEVQDADGRWAAVASGGQVNVRRDKPVLARITLTNLGEAEWMPPSSVAGVRSSSAPEGRRKVAQGVSPGVRTQPTPEPHRGDRALSVPPKTMPASDAVSDGVETSGAVYVVVQGEKAAQTPIPVPVPHLGSLQVADVALAPAGLKEPTTVTITLTAEGRTPFGPKVKLTLVPR